MSMVILVPKPVRCKGNNDDVNSKGHHHPITEIWGDQTWSLCPRAASTSCNQLGMMYKRVPHPSPPLPFDLYQNDVSYEKRLM